ncbi:MAG: XTP/dITP diphosphatase [Clostridiales bacterium]|nr:XTP/dITP diphosphatase [Clostridiales bacterium]
MRRIIFATSNEGKMKEIREILMGMDIELLSLKDAGIDIDIIEDGSSFEENAIIKAEAICKLTGEIVLADDSGLEIDYLDKAPGIYSARFLGENTPYLEKNTYIIEQLKNIPNDKRTARFVCTIACSFPGQDTITRTGIIEGYIADKISGSNGFGYDPIFYVPEYKCTTADMPAELKNKISHRAKALEAIKEVLTEHLDNR